MNTEARSKFLPHIIITGFVVHLIGGLAGAFAVNNSLAQIVFWQVATMCMISACVLMGAYMAEKGWPLASGGFVLLGISNGNFYSSLVVNRLEPGVMATGIILLLPAFIFIGLSNYFPVWLKWLSISVCIPFFYLYIRFLTGVFVPNEFLQKAAFQYEEIIAVLWSIYIWKDLKKNNPKTNKRSPRKIHVRE